MKGVRYCFALPSLKETRSISSRAGFRRLRPGGLFTSLLQELQVETGVLIALREFSFNGEVLRRRKEDFYLLFSLPPRELTGFRDWDILTQDFSEEAGRSKVDRNTC